jgi:hypothetical protein
VGLAAAVVAVGVRVGVGVIVDESLMAISVAKTSGPLFVGLAVGVRVAVISDGSVGVALGLTSTVAVTVAGVLMGKLEAVPVGTITALCVVPVFLAVEEAGDGVEVENN